MTKRRTARPWRLSSDGITSLRKAREATPMNTSSLVRRRLRRSTFQVTTVVLVLGLAACGTRLSEQDARSQLAGVYSTTAAHDGTGPALGSEPSGLPTGTPGSPSVSPGSPVSPVSSVSPTSSTNNGNSTGNSSSTASASEPDPSADKNGSRAPIVIGMTGWFSGIAGAALAPMRDGYAAWVGSVNARGGIDGHPVKLLIADNRGSGSEDLANAKRFVEEEGAVALVNIVAAGGAKSLEAYARSKNIPIVGGFAGEQIWLESPVLFAADGSIHSTERGWARAIKNKGLTKAAVLYCTEDQICKARADGWAKEADRLGIDVVYSAGVSFAQPDFTAQCVGTRNSGAQAIVTILDGASVNRVAQSCGRQGYEPVLVSPNPSPTVPSYRGEVIGVVTSFPWFLQSGTPALDEYGAAVKRYVRGPQNTVTSLGWVNGKLLETALSNGVSAKPTSADIFKGLWAMRHATIGGLTPPITFAKAGHAEVPCVYSIEASSGKWTAPQALRPNLCG